MIEYRDWLGKTRSQVKKMNHREVPAASAYKPWRAELFERLVANPKGFTWYMRVKEYTFLFPNFKKVVAVLEWRQEVIQKLLCDLVLATSQGETEFNDIKRGIESAIILQAKLFTQFFSHFQYECLEVIARARPDNFANEECDYVERGKDGTLIVVFKSKFIPALPGIKE